MARRVVVTGGASGIGRVMAEAFLALGDQVAVCDSSEANIQDMQRAHPMRIVLMCEMKRKCLHFSHSLRTLTAVWMF